MNDKYAIICSSYHWEKVVKKMFESAKNYFKNSYGVNYKQLELFNQIPGSYELPFAAQLAAKEERFKGVVCLGAILENTGMSDRNILLAGISSGIQIAILNTEKPIGFGIVEGESERMVNTAFDDGRTQAQRKSEEAVIACMKMAELKNTFSQKGGNIEFNS